MAVKSKGNFWVLPFNLFTISKRYSQTYDLRLSTYDYSIQLYT
jgi:hypothetical protein